MTSAAPRHATDAFKLLLKAVAMTMTFMSNSNFISIPNLVRMRETSSSFNSMNIKLSTCDLPYYVPLFAMCCNDLLQSF